MRPLGNPSGQRTVKSSNSNSRRFPRMARYSANWTRGKIPRARSSRTTWSSSGPSESDHAAAHLVEFNRFKQGLEITLAEALIPLALDDFEKYRPENIGREDLQENAILRRTIDQNAPALKLGQVLLVTLDTARYAVIIRVGCILEDDAAGPQAIDGAIYVIGGQGQMLNALPPVLLQILFNLRLVILGFIDRDPNLSAWTRHRF